MHVICVRLIRRSLSISEPFSSELPLADIGRAHCRLPEGKCPIDWTVESHDFGDGPENVHGFGVLTMSQK